MAWSDWVVQLKKAGWRLTGRVLPNGRFEIVRTH